MLEGEGVGSVHFQVAAVYHGWPVVAHFDESLSSLTGRRCVRTSSSPSTQPCTEEGRLLIPVTATSLQRSRAKPSSDLNTTEAETETTEDVRAV